MEHHLFRLAACTVLLAYVTGCGRRPGPERPDLSAPSSDAARTLPYRFRIEVFPGKPAANAATFAAAPGGRLVVGSETGIEVLSPAGERVAAWSTTDAPACVACSPDGRVFVCTGDTVTICDMSGKRLAQWKDPARLGVPVDLAVAAPDVFIADARTRSVHHYAENGDYIGDIAKRDPETGEPGLIVPSPHLPVAVAGDDLLLVADPGRRAVQTRRFSGELVRKWGVAGLGPGRFSGCCNPVALACISRPEPLIITAEKGARRVQAFFPDGRPAAYAGPENFARAPGVLDLTTTPDGRIFVLDAPARKILILTVKPGGQPSGKAR